MTKVGTFRELKGDAREMFLSKCVWAIHEAINDETYTAKSLNAKAVSPFIKSIFIDAIAGAWKQHVMESVFTAINAWVHANPKALGCSTLINTGFEGGVAKDKKGKGSEEEDGEGEADDDDDEEEDDEEEEEKPAAASAAASAAAPKGGKSANASKTTMVS